MRHAAWLPAVAEGWMSVAVFLPLSARGVWMPPEELQRYLADELDKCARANGVQT